VTRAVWLLVGAAACGPGPAGAGPRTAGAVVHQSIGVGGQATDFTLRDLDGRMVRLSDHLGRDVVLLDFWTTWCVPCQAELPLLEQLYQREKDRGFVVLAISMDGPETVAQVPSYARRYALSFPVLLDEETKVTAIYDPTRAAPLSVLIDRRGQIARVRDGYAAGDEKLLTDDVANLVAGH
jgi:peroxiredoxin